MRRNEYDEKGLLIRAYVQMTQPHTLSYKYDDKGHQIEATVDNKLWFTKQYNAQGKIVCELFGNGGKRTYEYLDNVIKETITLKTGKTTIRTLNAFYQPIQEATKKLSNGAEANAPLSPNKVPDAVPDAETEH
jgi:hypothetical protein